MADEDPCGSESHSKFLQNFENVTDFTQVHPNDQFIYLCVYCEIMFEAYIN